MTSLTIDQRHNGEGIVKAGELIEIRETTALTLHDRRVLNLLVENAGPGIADDIDHHIPIHRLRGPTHKGGERVKDSVIRLMATLVEVKIKDRKGGAATKRLHLLSETTTTDDESNPNGEVTYSFSKTMREILQQSSYWGRIKSHVMFSFSSKYSLVLYEQLCLRANLRTNRQTFSVEAFRAMLGIEDGKLEQFKNLNKWAIQPAETEINGLSDFNVEIFPVRTGGIQRGKVTGFEVTWGRKDPEDWKTALDEQMRSKIGRIARLKGQAELPI